MTLGSQPYTSSPTTVIRDDDTVATANERRLLFGAPPFSGSVKAWLELQHFFQSRPNELVADKHFHTPSKGTRRPMSFDMHLHDLYRLKRVVKLPELPIDLISIAEHALSSYPSDLPPGNEDFPTPEILKLNSRLLQTREINNEAGVEQAYDIAVARHCAVVAGTLEFKLNEWCRSSLRWNKVRQSAVPEGLTAAQAIPDGYLNIVGDDDTYTLTPRERDILKHFPVIAIWEFKNLNFDSRGKAVGDKIKEQIFHEVTHAFLDDLFPWDECDKGEQCPVVHPNVGVTAVRMGNDAEVSPCPSYAQAPARSQVAFKGPI